MLNDTETPHADAEAIDPGHGFTPRQVRILKISVIVMGVLLVAGFALLLLGIYLQATKIGKAPSRSPTATSAGMSAHPGAAPVTVPVTIEPGTDVGGMVAENGNLILHLKRDGKSEFSVIDLETGRERWRFTLTPRP